MTESTNKMHMSSSNSISAAHVSIMHHERKPLWCICVWIFCLPPFLISEWTCPAIILSDHNLPHHLNKWKGRANTGDGCCFYLGTALKWNGVPWIQRGLVEVKGKGSSTIIYLEPSPRSITVLPSPLHPHLFTVPWWTFRVRQPQGGAKRSYIPNHVAWAGPDFSRCVLLQLLLYCTLHDKSERMETDPINPLLWFRSRHFALLIWQRHLFRIGSSCSCSCSAQKAAEASVLTRSLLLSTSDQISTLTSWDRERSSAFSLEKKNCKGSPTFLLHLSFCCCMYSCRIATRATLRLSR